MYLSSRLWVVFERSAAAPALNCKWVISNRDAAQPVQCICAAGFCHLARKMTTKETPKQEFAIPRVSFESRAFSRID